MLTKAYHYQEVRVLNQDLQNLYHVWLHENATLTLQSQVLAVILVRRVLFQSFSV